MSLSFAPRACNLASLLPREELTVGLRIGITSVSVTDWSMVQGHCILHLRLLLTQGYLAQAHISQHCRKRWLLHARHEVPYQVREGCKKSRLARPCECIKDRADHDDVCKRDSFSDEKRLGL
mmetsp:Transcript_3163/g.11425  ORF Transcript_3163/g.11425 Transcript_3163/m.11425 type:complete len:122 (+) Transcript_3163:661-1026(+)